jgi:uncharacterized protein
MRLDSRVWLFGGLALVAVALAYGLHAISNGISARDTRDTVTVTGSAKQRVTSDFVNWNASVSAQDVKPGVAAAQLDRWTTAVRAFLLKSGIKSDELTVSPITTERLSETDDTGSQHFTGFSLTRGFEVHSARVDEIVAAIEASSQLVANGIPLTASPAEFIYTKLAELRPVLSSAATKDAINRAKTVIGEAGAKIGKLKSIDVGPFQLTAPGSIGESDYGEYDTSTRDKDVTSVVNVTFAIK